jgi:hypothetical protein
MTRKSKILIFLVSLVSLLVAAFIALTFFVVAPRRSAKIATWRLNLEQIEVAKHEWADDRVSTTNDTPTLDDLRPYLSDWVTNHISLTNGELVDPNGGVYTIGRVGELPSCLIGGRRVYP